MPSSFEIADILARLRSGVSPVDILDGFTAHSRRMAAGSRYMPYREILALAFAAAFADHGLVLDSEGTEQLAFAPTRMDPHPDVPEALRRLREHYRLAIITNSDDALIAPTITRIGVPIDHVITSEQARGYKPSPRLFEHAWQAMDVSPNDTVHVAMGMYADIQACHDLGFRGIWVNRCDEAGNPDWLPYAEVTDVAEAAALLLKWGR